MTDGEQYEPRSILITGGCGFIGSHVVRHLATKYPQYILTVLDKMDYCSSKDHLTDLLSVPGEEEIKSPLKSPKSNSKGLISAGVQLVHGNLLSADLIAYILRAHSIDTVMHFAASTHVDNSFTSSISFTENNVMGTHTLLECCRLYGKVKRIIHVSTDEVYGGEGLLQTEEAMLAPTNPYACSKAAAEFLVRGYMKSFDVPVIITRGNNVYGPHQFPDKLIPKTATLLSSGMPCFIHGDGSHMRNFLYCTDAAEAFDVVLHKGKLGEVYNIGSPTEVTNLEAIRTLMRILGLTDESKYLTYVKDRAFNDVRYSIDSSKLHSLGWAPKVSWEEGMRMTLEWYQKPENLARWPNYTNGLVAHPSLDASSRNFAGAANVVAPRTKPPP